MKLKLLLAVVSVVVLSACSKNYDYSGAFAPTNGDDCEVKEGESTFITISPALENETTYTARLSSQMSGGGVFPLESKPSKVSEDGSITFSFFKEGKSGLFSGEPAVEMRIKVQPKDAGAIYLESWPVVISSSDNSAYNATFDFIKDTEISMMGRRAPNDMSRYAGKNGLCLKKE